VTDPQLNVEGIAQVGNGQQVLDLLMRNESEGLRVGSALKNPRRKMIIGGAIAPGPEGMDARLLEQAKHLGVVDVPVSIQIRPAKRCGDI